MLSLMIYTIVFLYGIVIGSFLNVCIYRIPLKESVAKERSHCMTCGYQLRWYDLFPLFSYLFLGGKCRKCKAKISVQYPLIEGLNGILYIFVFMRYGVSIESLLYCLLFSALLVLSVVDFRTYEIPVGINVFILVLGLVRVATDYQNWLFYLIGFFSVSFFLMILFVATGGNGIGGGDVKLMAVSGLMIGWQLNLLSLGLGCILGSVIHVVRMKMAGEGRVLALGPYLSVGIMISVLAGQEMIHLYLTCIGFYS